MKIYFVEDSDTMYLVKAADEQEARQIFESYPDRQEGDYTIREIRFDGSVAVLHDW